MVKKTDSGGMGIYSLLLSITMVAGVLRFSGISLIDEMVYLLLLTSLIFYRINKKNSFGEYQFGKYYSRARVSFRLLIFYLICSLFYGLLFDQYFGKLRWLIIFVGLLLSDSMFLYYLSKRMNGSNRFRLIGLVYNYVLVFTVVYVLYGLVAKYLFNVPPGNIQDAQIDAWYAIWGTSAYTAIIFVPLLLFNKVLRINRYISKIKYLAVYAITAIAAVFYDSRVMMLMLLAFFGAEFFGLKARHKALVMSSAAILLAGFGVEMFSSHFSSSGGFLISLLGDGAAVPTGGDFDRVAHYIAAYDILSNSLIEALIGSGFLNAGKAIIPAYLSVYSDYGMATGPITFNLSGASMGTFGLSAFLIENGLIGAFLFIVHLYNLCMVALKTSLIVPSIFIVATYAVLLPIFFSIYINDNMLFYLLLTPSIFLYPLISSQSNNVKS
jgi:hypothetical protein